MTESKKPEIEKVRISAEDMMKIWDMVENPPEPNARLKLAAKRYKEFLGGRKCKTELDIAIFEMAEALHSIGKISKAKMQEFEETCLVDNQK